MTEPQTLPLIRPFAAVRPGAGRAQEVIAPLYDVLDADEARRRVAGRPLSFLHVSRAEIDVPDTTNPYADAVYDRARATFDAMRAQGVLRRDERACYYVYRLEAGDSAQTGLVAATSLAAYAQSRIRRHEFTQPDRETDRARQIDRLNAHTGPVLLTYRRRAAIDAVIARAASGGCDADVTSEDGVRHRLWVVRDDSTIADLTSLFESVERLYIADGHHRTAAAARVAEARRRGAQAADAEAGHERFLAMLVPDSEVRIVDYNRAVRDLNGLSVRAFVEATRASFDVALESSPARPRRASEFGMYVDGTWYRLRSRERGMNGHAKLPRLNGHAALPGVNGHAALPRLDVDVLHEALLAPILGVGDARFDGRLAFVAGGRGLSALERCVDAKEMAVAFALYPTSLADMISIADAGLVMPPKSTCFEPKVVDGLLCYVLE